MSEFHMKIKTSIYVDKDKWEQFKGHAVKRGLQASDVFEEIMDDDAAAEELLSGLSDARVTAPGEIEFDPVVPKDSVSQFVRNERDGRNSSLPR